MSSRVGVRAINHRACGLYTPGHQVQFIQAKLAWEGNPADHRSGTVQSVDDDGWITIEVGGETLSLLESQPGTGA